MSHLLEWQKKPFGDGEDLAEVKKKTEMVRTHLEKMGFPTPINYKLG